MKNKIFKVCALGLVTAVVFTGCTKNEGKVNKINKEHEYSSNVVLDEQEGITDYYDLLLYKYDSNKDAKEAFNDDVKFIKENHATVINASDSEFISKYELRQGEAMVEETNYCYTLDKIKDNERLALEYCDTKDDYTFIENVSTNLQKYISKYNSLKEAYEKFAIDNNLDVQYDGLYEAEQYSRATNLTLVNYNKLKVEKVSIEKIDLADNKYKKLLVAKTSDGKRVWSLDMGIYEKGVKYNSCETATLGDKYVYVTGNNTIYARDIQTGKIKWTPINQMSECYDKVLETKNGIYAINTSAYDNNSDIAIDVVSYTGENVAYLDSLLENSGVKNYQINNLDSIKVNGDYIIIDVYKSKASKTPEGKIKVNTKNNTFSFEK